MLLRRKDQELPGNCLDVSDVQMVRKLRTVTLGEGKRAREVEELAYGWGEREKLPTSTGTDDEFIAEKHREWPEERNPVMKHGTFVRPTMYMASLDIKTAFDKAKPKHVAQILDDHNTHGWLIAALLRGMSVLSGMASFERVESRFSFNRCLRQRSMEAPRLWQKMASQILANVEEEWMNRRKRSSLEYGRRKSASTMQLYVG